MGTPRFFCDLPLDSNTRIMLPADLAHYAGRVLRLKNYSDIVLFNGQGGEYPAKIVFENNTSFAELGPYNPRDVELAGPISLAQGLPSADKMDWIIEKASELGVQSITPIYAERSIVRLQGSRLEKRLVHWQKIAESASEQCGRNRVLTVKTPCSLAHYLQHELESNTTTLLCHTEKSQSLAQALASLQSSGTQPHLNFLIGPEGGWSEKERAQACEKGIPTIQFGSRILRTETAGIALVAAASALLGWV